VEGTQPSGEIAAVAGSAQERIFRHIELTVEQVEIVNAGPRGVAPTRVAFVGNVRLTESEDNGKAPGRREEPSFGSKSAGGVAEAAAARVQRSQNPSQRPVAIMHDPRDRRFRRPEEFMNVIG